MQQFKRFYTHPEEAPAKNVTTCQPCFRTSDIDEVGDDTHLTFFEMLGNFSFGGYFKKEAIEWGYEFLTKELGIKQDRIWCSIFSGDEKNPRDDESAKILEKMGIKYKEFPREDCFWGPTGDEGPCGPCVEMFVDDIEVWTLVFNEYYKNTDGSYRKLETPGVDTGMGLERMLVVKNDFKNVYETDVFEPIIKKIEEISSKKYQEFQKEFGIIADHIKAATFAINDGILPSNKDAGYIVRRLIRRAIVKAKKLGIENNFISQIAKKIIETYPNYTFDEKIFSELEKEEQKFRNTLKAGLGEFEKVRENLDGGMAFRLYETYGFPLEMTEELAKENNINFYKKDFEEAFKAHQEKSRTASAGMFKGGLASGGEIETKFHTATHLLLASLREILGKEVNQKGANINSERIRFDFNWPEKLSDEQIKQVEDWVNDKIAQNLDVKMEEMSLAKALQSGATSIPGFKYPDVVKVFSIGNISREICGGPHVKNTSELGHFKIIKEESSSAGVRRLKAVLE
jgi:alanyl-tRNA synthetase